MTFDTNLLPKYWKFKGKYPYGLFTNSPLNLTIYTFMIFDYNRTILLNKSFNNIGSMERRYAKLLLEEAKEKSWINNIYVNYKNIVELDEYYPIQCPLTVFVDASTVNLSHILDL